jgi:hypothetical protein
MNIHETRKLAYDYVDFLLFGLQDERIHCLGNLTDDYVKSKPWYYLFKQIIDKYHLIGYLNSDRESITGTINLAHAGLNAIEAGGIREYIIDTDKELILKDGYPKVVTIGYENGLQIGKVMIEDKTEDEVFSALYNDPEYVFTQRRSRREETAIPITTPIPQVPVTINQIGGNVGTLYNNSLNSNENVISNQSPAGKKSWLENSSWIATIIAAILTAIGLWWAFHTGK